MSEKELEYLNQKVSHIFETEPAVVRLDHSRVILVGDLHGDLESLEFILEMAARFECSRFVFLGDYVDRGEHSVEVLCRLFRLKIDHPEKLILLRGNHETAEINACYGFYHDIGRDEELFTVVNRTFDRMPIAAVVNGSVFCAHGGIGEPVSLDLIEKEDCFAYLWNDPCDDPSLTVSAQRGGTEMFGPDVCEEFFRINGLEKVVRAHWALETGYKWWFDGKLLSLFSIPDYCGRKGMGAFALMEKGQIEIFVFGRSSNSSLSLIDPGN